MIEEIQKEINALRDARKATSRSEPDEVYNELLKKYEHALVKIHELETQVNSNTQSKVPSKDDVEAMSGMLDLINKLDDSTIEKLNKFGNMK